MVNEDAPDLETLVEDSRNPHAIRQYIAMGDEIARLQRERDEAVRVAEKLGRLRSRTFGKVCEWHDLIESEQELDDSAGDGISVRDVVLKEMEDVMDALREAMGAAQREGE